MEENDLISEKVAIDCRSWLNEMGLQQYEQVFLTNFSLNSSDKFLSIDKILKIRVADFPKLNITNYDHQRILLERIQRLFVTDYDLPELQKSIPIYEVYDPNNANTLAPKFAYEISQPHNSRSRRSSQDNTSQTSGLPAIRVGQTLDELRKGQGIVYKDKDKVEVQQTTSRRKSFDERAWTAIAKHNQHMDKQSKVNALEQLRSGSSIDHNFDPTKDQVGKNGKKPRQRRWTLTEIADDQDSRSRALTFGNKAQEFDKIQRELRIMQEGILSRCKKVIGCEMASILFMNHITRELLIFVETQQWIRVPVDSSIAGACVKCGQIFIVPDAYADSRFNRSVDIATNFRTRNILCAPVRSFRRAGAVVAVIEMINKIAKEGFDEQDELVLQSVVEKVADSLDTQFKDLMDAVSVIGEIGNVKVDPSHKFDEPTVASQASAVRAISSLRGDSQSQPVDRLEAVKDEQHRRQRRLSYDPAAACAHCAPVEPSVTPTTALPVIVRRDSEEKPRWVGKTARIVGEVPALTEAAT